MTAEHPPDRSSPLRAEVENGTDQGVIRLFGALDTGTALSADAAFDMVKDRDAVQIDVSGLTYLDHTGLASLMNLQDHLRGHGGAIHLIGSRPETVSEMTSMCRHGE